MRRVILATAILMGLAVSSSFGLFISDIGFPFKGFVYSAIGISKEDRTNITVDLQTTDRFNITYKGKKYKAQLFPYGSIYLEREGQNSLLISFDVKEFRMHGRFPF